MPWIYFTYPWGREHAKSVCIQGNLEGDWANPVSYTSGPLRLIPASVASTRLPIGVKGNISHMLQHKWVAWVTSPTGLCWAVKKPIVSLRARSSLTICGLQLIPVSWSRASQLFPAVFKMRTVLILVCQHCYVKRLRLFRWKAQSDVLDVALFLQDHLNQHMTFHRWIFISLQDLFLVIMRKVLIYVFTFF